MYQTVLQQGEHLVLGDEAVRIDVVHAKAEGHPLGRGAAQEHGQAADERLQAQRLVLVVALPRDEQPVHQELLDHNVEGAVQQLTEAVGVDALRNE